MTDRRANLCVVAVLVALLGGCAAQVAAPPSTSGFPAAFPAAYYERLQRQGQPVFRIDAAHSLVVIAVRRSGSLARLGHDHVVASHDVAGYIAPDQGRADFYVPLDALVVDEPALRAEAGMQTQPTPDQIAGTRRNMLEHVLETHSYPYALVAFDDRGKTLPRRVNLTLHGRTEAVEVSPRIEEAAEEVSVEGSLAIDQSRFGIAPFAILGGAVAVQDRVDITFRLRADRVTGREP